MSKNGYVENEDESMNISVFISPFEGFDEYGTMESSEMEPFRRIIQLFL